MKKKFDKRWIFAGLAGVAVLLIVVGVVLLTTPKINRPTDPSTNELETGTESVYLSETPAEPTEAAPVVVDTHEGEAKSFLTGEWISEELSKKRPMAIMTENSKRTLPQYGVSKADILYECPVEGGMTRMMAIYQDYSGMERIGNIRSCRNYYVYFANEFDAVYWHCGGSHFAKDLLKTDIIDHVDAITGKAEPYYYRSTDRRAPHNLYTSSDQIVAALEKYDFRTEHEADFTSHYQFAEEGQAVTLDQGTTANKVSLYYPDNKPWFEYNAEDGLYYRYEFGEPQVDGMNGQQLAVKNIILQDCDWYLWEESTGYLYVDVSSGGTGKYITNGKVIDITWKKESESSITRYYDGNGKEITLNPGKTWVSVIQDSYKDRVSFE